MINKEVCDILMFIGIGPDKKGFSYLQLVTEIMYHDPSITLREAYKKIALAKKANACTIDSSIRNVIHSAFNSGKLARLNSKMGVEVIDKDNYPTNKAFVSYLIHCLKGLTSYNPIPQGAY